MGSKSSSSGVQFFPGQKQQAAKVFAPGGIFDEFLAGKPNAGFERSQNNAMKQMENMQARMGMSGQPLAMRQQNEFLQKSTQMGADNFNQTLFNFMQPAGSQSTGGTPGFAAQAFGKG